MYPASEAFHEAVAQGNEQMPLLIFKDAVFTGDDIDVDDGISFDDNFSLDEDISIGQTPANEIKFTLFNDKKLLNKYEFGDFVATIGVKLGQKRYTQTTPVMVITGYAKYTGENEYPFIKRDGTALSVQPNFPVKSLLGYDGKVWAFAADGRHAVYDDKTGANITSSNKLNNFMINKVKGWDGYGYFYNKKTRILFIYYAGVREQYEFVPLGTFTADRPNVPDQIRIDMTCRDQMLKFDKDWPGFSRIGVTFPTTVGAIFKAMCDYLEVPYLTTDFLNSTLAVKKEPKDKFENVTMRTVLGWIAEVAASNARFNRDGKLIMAWINEDTGQIYAEGDYYEFKPYWYKTKKINKLYNRASSSGKDSTVGTGNNGYLIQDNPFIPV